PVAVLGEHHREPGVDRGERSRHAADPTADHREVRLQLRHASHLRWALPGAPWSPTVPLLPAVGGRKRRPERHRGFRPPVRRAPRWGARTSIAPASGPPGPAAPLSSAGPYPPAG